MSEKKRDNLRLALVISDETGFRYRSGLHRLLAELIAQGISVCIVGAGTWLSEEAPAAGIVRIPYPETEVPGTRWLQRRQLVGALNAFAPSVLHALGEESAWVVRFLAHQLDLPYVLNINTLQPEDRRLPISSLRCAGLLAPCPSIRRSLEARYARFNGRIGWAPLVLPIGDQPACFSDTHHKTCVVVGCSFEDPQTLRPLLQAIGTMHGLGYDFLTVFIGHGRRESGFRQLVTELDMQGEVTLVSDRRPWRSILLAADVFVQLNEACAYDALCQEAMSVGLAVAARRGGCDDFLIEGQTCIHFTGYDVHGVQTVLQRLLDEPDLARELARTAQHTVRSQASLDRMMRTYLAMYESVRSWSYGLESIPA